MVMSHFFLHLLMATALAYLARQHWLLKQRLSSGIDAPRDDMLPCKSSSAGVGKVLEKGASVDQLPSSPSASSSVWCWGDQHTDRICRFRNLYYLPNKEQFAFLHGEDSVYVGLPVDRFDPALLDLSSVRDHNVNYFNYMDMLYSKSHHVFDNVRVVRGRSLVFRRFHPENLMHVIHDDLLPMFHTLVTMDMEYVAKSSSFEVEPFDVHLVLMDGLNPGPFRELYESFSALAPLYRKEMHTSGQPICFTNAIVGLSKYTTWYQYGFAEPQGPIQNHNVTAWDLRRFGRFLKSRLNITETEERYEPSTARTAVLLTRKSTRLITNEFDLTLALAQSLHMKVITMAIETHSLVDMIGTLSTATVLLGMHGSLLSLALFLPPGSILVELFPYAVNPDHYTPYKTLVSLPGMEVEYVAWRNLDVTKSVTHVDRTWDQGGIAHLGPEEQQRILNSTEVPRHLCCRDPEWLFRIYQDTAVNIEAVVQLIQSKFQHPVYPSTSGEMEATESPHPTGIQTNRIFPSYVSDITCNANSSPTSLFVAWKPPENLEFISYRSIRYEVWIQEYGVDDYVAWILSKTSHHFTAADIRPAVNYNIWIRCLMDDSVGPFNLNNVTCRT